MLMGRLETRMAAPLHFALLFAASLPSASSSSTSPTVAANAALVDELNRDAQARQGGAHAVFGLNEFADVSSADFARERLMPKRRHPAAALEEARRRALPTHHHGGGDGRHGGAAAAAALPESFDWRDYQGVVTSVKDQGSVGTCWAFSTAANLEGQLFLSSGTARNLSVEQFVECDASDDPDGLGGFGCADCGVFGGWPYLAYDYAAGSGGVYAWEDWDYCVSPPRGSSLTQCWPCMPEGYSRSDCGNHGDFYCDANSTQGQRSDGGLCRSPSSSSSSSPSSLSSLAAAGAKELTGQQQQQQQRQQRQQQQGKGGGRGDDAERGVASVGVAGVAVEVSGWVAVSSNETAMAAALQSSGPLSVLLNAEKLQFYKNGVYAPSHCDPGDLDHAVLLVGWGVAPPDSSSSSNNGGTGGIGGTGGTGGDYENRGERNGTAEYPPSSSSSGGGGGGGGGGDGTPYWVVKNSWGASWGEDGFFRIQRGVGMCGINTAVTTGIVAATQKAAITAAAKK